MRSLRYIGYGLIGGVLGSLNIGVKSWKFWVILLSVMFIDCISEYF